MFPSSGYFLPKASVLPEVPRHLSRNGLDEKFWQIEVVPGPSMTNTFESCTPGPLSLLVWTRMIRGDFLKYTFLGPCPRPSESESLSWDLGSHF